MRRQLTIALFLICAKGISQSYPTYFLSDDPPNKKEWIVQNHVRTEKTYYYRFAKGFLGKKKIIDSVLLYDCQYDTLGNPLIRKRFIPGRNTTFIDSLVYNKNGYLTAIYNFHFFKGDKKNFSTDIFSYDNDGLIRRRELEIVANREVVRESASYEYDSLRTPTKESWSRHDTLYIVNEYHYNSNGDVSKMTSSEPHGQLRYAIAYDYNYKQHILTQYNLQLGDKQSFRCRTEFDNFQRPVRFEKKHHHYNGKNVITLFTYTKEGLLHEMQESGSVPIEIVNRHYYIFY